MKQANIPEIPAPPPLDQFKEEVTSAALVESLREIRRCAFLNAVADKAWCPHLQFVEDFMRARGISFNAPRHQL
jgi:hypothetical protein